MPYGRKTVRLTLTETEYFARVRVSLTLDEIEALPAVPTIGEVLDEERDKAAKHRRDCFLAASIAEWNLDDDNGDAIPINSDTVRRLAVPDSNAILDITNAKRPPEDQFTFTPTSTPGSAAPEETLPKD